MRHFVPPPAFYTTAVELRVRSRVKNGQFSKLATSLVWRATVQINPVQKPIAEKQWDLSKL